MAKRVNKQFVVILGASLLGVGAAGAGAIYYKRSLGLDPVAIKTQAADAEKAGDLVKAAALYQRAAEIMAQRHTPGADAMYVKLADLASKLSAGAKSPEEGIRYWQISEAALQLALSESPRNADVHLRVIENSHSFAQLSRSAPAWSSLEDLVKRFLENQQAKTSKPYEYRAEAILESAKLLTTEVPDSRLDAAEADIKKARELAPDSGRAAALQGDLLAFKAFRADRRSANEDSARFWAEFEKVTGEFLQKHPNNPEVTDLVAYTLSARRRYKEAFELAEKAYAAHPGNKALAVRLATMCLISDPGDPRNPAAEKVQARPEMTEKIFKELVAAEPENAEGHFRLAMFYKGRRQAAEAIAAYKACLSHITVGGGLQASRNQWWMTESYDGIAALSLDLAEFKGLESEQGKAAMAEAATYIEKLRESHVRDRGMIDLLDGRVQLLKRNMPQAIKILTEAEQNLSRSQGMNERLLQTRMLLAVANQRLYPPQLGKALEHLDAALQLSRTVGLLLQKAAILNQLRRFEDAEALMEQLIVHKAQLPPEVTRAAEMHLATARQGLGKRDGLGQAATTQQADWQTLPVNGQLQLVGMLLNEGDNAQALSIAKTVIDQNPEKPNPVALRFAALAHVRLGERDEAMKVVDKALEKYPGVPEFEAMRATLKNPGQTNEATLAIINSLSDEYVKQLQLSIFYRSQQNADKEIEALRAAQAIVGESTAPDAADRFSDVVERLFNAGCAAAKSTPDEQVKDRYWKVAEEAVRQAERRDLDGVKGKLFRGRLELIRSNGAQGLTLVEQAVAQRPDYSTGHSILAQAYYAQRPPRYDDALNEFRKALALVPNDVSLLRANIAMLMRQPDAKNMEEARKLLNSGLRFAPRDRVLLALHDAIGEREEAIKLREAFYRFDPRNSENTQALVELYTKARKQNPQGVARAIEIVRPLAEKEGAELRNVAMLAQLYAVSERVVDGKKVSDVEKGLRLFDPYIASPDAAQRYRGLLALGEFCAGKDVNRIDDAAQAFKAAIKIQPEGEDRADRHLGDLYFEIQDMAGAEAVYQGILTKIKVDDERRDTVARRVIEAQIRQQKFAEAEQSLQKEVFDRKPAELKTADGQAPSPEMIRFRDRKIAEAHAQGLVLRALMRIEQNRMSDAIVDLDAALVKRPDYPDALYYRALAQIGLPDGNLDRAASDLQTVKAHADERMSLNARRLLTRVLRGARRYVEAADEYAQILNVDPDQVAVRREYAGFLMSLVEAQRRVHRESVDPMSSALRLLNPDVRLQELLRASTQRYGDQDAIWILMQAQLLSLRGNNFEAQRYYQAIHRFNPEDPAATNYYVMSLLESRNFAEAEALASRVLAKNPDILYLLFRRAAAYKGLGRVTDMNADIDRAFDVAVRACAAAKSYDPFLAALSQAGEVAPPAKEATLAERLRARLASRPGETITAIGLMHVLVLSNQTDEAMQVLAKTPVPEGDEPLKGLYLKEAGMVRYQAKDMEGAAKAYTDYLAMRPQDMEALNNFAFLLSESLGKPQEALSHAVRAVKLLETQADPTTYVVNQASYYDTLGWVKLQNKDLDGAIADLKRSVSAQPLPLAYFHLAKAFHQARRLTDAANMADLGLKIARDTKDPSLPQLEALEKELNPGVQR